MLFSDSYKTIAEPSESLFKDRGSRFLGLAFPVITELEVKEHLNLLRTAHAKANHFCWALRLTPDRSVYRVNDDGEPSGTAGKPILNTLLSADLTNTLIVVVRYFGGTLLGVPGLVNAYKTAATEAIAEAEIIEKTINDIYELQFDYLKLNEVMKIIKEENLPVSNQEFDNNCSLRISVPKSRLNRVLAKLESMDGVKTRYLSTI